VQPIHWIENRFTEAARVTFGACTGIAGAILPEEIGQLKIDLSRGLEAGAFA